MQRDKRGGRTYQVGEARGAGNAGKTERSQHIRLG